MTNPTQDFEMTDSVKKAMVGHIMGELAPTQRFFMVKVTGCKDCPYARHKQVHCNIPMTSVGAEKVYAENKDQLTNSCPMYVQSQEVEK